MLTTQIVNIDFLSVGVAVAANLILGFVIFFKDSKNATNVLFLLQTFILSVWSVLNYLTYTVTDLHYALLVERLVMFFAIPNSVIFMLLIHTFPNARITLRGKTLFGLIGISLVVMGIALSPLLFSDVKVVPGIITPQPIVGIGMIAFIPVAILSIFIGIYLLIRRYIGSSGNERMQLRFLLIGVVIMFLLIFALNFILPAFFNNTRFIPLSAVFTLPFVIFTAYAIFKHHLLNVKMVSTEILAFVLTIATLIEVIITSDPLILVFRSGVFLLVLAFSILLIKSVRKEVEQREELERLAGDLKQANAKLEDLSRLKTQLLSLASHQIKSPLAAIKGFTEILIEGIYGQVNDKVKETLVKMKKSADGLVNLIDTLLNVRKVEEGRMDYQFARIDFRKLVEDTVEELRPLAGEKKLEFTFTAPHEAAWVNADAQKLKQVVQNLIDNAIKYTPMGFVKVEVAPKESTYVLSVTDSGLGIPDELITHLFEEFIRDERVKKDILGTGLGLFIARKIVDAHSGKIWAESGGKDKGSRFYVALKSAK